MRQKIRNQSNEWRHKRLYFYPRILGTLLCVLLYRLAGCIFLPFLDTGKIIASDNVTGIGLLARQGVAGASVAALGISPYITASILSQIAISLIPSLSKLQKDGALGMNYIRRMVYMFAFGIGFIQAYLLCGRFFNSGFFITSEPYGFWIDVALLTCVSGMFALIGAFMDKRLFGSGLSILLMSDILSGMPAQFVWYFKKLGLVKWLAFCFVFICVFFFSYWIEGCERKIPVTYNRDVNMNQHPYFPVKLLSGGIMPVLFASSATSLLSNFGGWVKRVFDMSLWLDMDDPIPSVGIALYFLLIFFFSRYYQILSLNEIEIADNLSRSGCVIEGVLPGRDTESYLRRQLVRTGRFGSLCLCLVAFLPVVFARLFGIASASVLGTKLVVLMSIVNNLIYSFDAERLTWRYMGQYPRVVSNRNKIDECNYFMIAK